MKEIPQSGPKLEEACGGGGWDRGGIIGGWGVGRGDTLLNDVVQTKKKGRKAERKK